ncbi:O-methyltransferase [Shouchella shacheensis]|uniref:O-methyltransferase n=1 Tax=Shouchella shacheensis TaxID=1649580 RepID=UPI00073FC4DC|nr:O-methyltransferase [Shouchella shacheensis]
MNNRVNDYVASLVPPRPPLVEEMEAFAVRSNVPIMDLVGIESMLVQLSLFDPGRILEIGTAIGYSAIRMAHTVPRAEIVTIERDEDRYMQACDYVREAGLQERITVLNADAKAAVSGVEQYAPFDVLFIDAAKGQYQSFFKLYTPLLRTGGVVLSDNVLFRGLVAEEKNVGMSKRLQSIAKKIRRYNEWLANHPQFETRILPIGDGLSVSIKKSNT